jgi:hypothetical protein
MTDIYAILGGFSSSFFCLAGPRLGPIKGVFLGEFFVHFFTIFEITLAVSVFEFFSVG